MIEEGEDVYCHAQVSPRSRVTRPLTRAAPVSASSTVTANLRPPHPPHSAGSKSMPRADEIFPMRIRRTGIPPRRTVSPSLLTFASTCIKARARTPSDPNQTPQPGSTKKSTAADPSNPADEGTGWDKPEMPRIEATRLIPGGGVPIESDQQTHEGGPETAHEPDHGKAFGSGRPLHAEERSREKGDSGQPHHRQWHRDQSHVPVGIASDSPVDRNRVGQMGPAHGKG